MTYDSRRSVSCWSQVVVHYTLHASHKTAGVTLKLKPVNMQLCKSNRTCTSNFKSCFWPEKSFVYFFKVISTLREILTDFLSWSLHCHLLLWCDFGGCSVQSQELDLMMLVGSFQLLWVYLKYHINMTTQHCRINILIKQPFTVWFGMNTLNCSSVVLKMPKGD